ncbi:hypothetical protein CR513_13019, partial [Mucuna pruriens]
MVRCMLSTKGVPKSFWTEVVTWTFYLLNRYPIHAIKNITPQEAWSGIKPSIKHLRVWGCVAHVHIPEAKRGVSDESKGYHLFNPKTKRIVVSKDVMFEEEKSWDWGSHYKEQIEIELVWGDDEFHSDNENNDDEKFHSAGENNEGSNEVVSSQEHVIQGRERRKLTWMGDFVSGED